MQNLKLNANPVGANCIRPHFEEITLKEQKGITLIALIITIIVMLILVGVTINVALNGGLFQKAEKATYQTQASTVKEQLEIAKAVAIAKNGGKALDDYSIITVENLENLDEDTKIEYGNKILITTDGKVCYNPENVTVEEGKWLEEIGINAYVSTELTEEEKTEISTLILQYATASRNNDTEGMTVAKNALLEKGVNLGEVIQIEDSTGQNYYYCHNAKMMVNETDLSIVILDSNQVKILDELYEIALLLDEKIETQGCPKDGSSIFVEYKGQMLEADSVGLSSDMYFDLEYKGYYLIKRIRSKFIGL